jgi:hypothetical protein
MTGFESKRKMAQDKLDDEADTLTIVYQRGFADGKKAAQRPWQGLTDEDVNKESAIINQQKKLAFQAGMYVAQQILKERNT